MRNRIRINLLVKTTQIYACLIDFKISSDSLKLREKFI